MIELFYLQAPSLEDFEKEKEKLLEFLPIAERNFYLNRPVGKPALSSFLGKVFIYWIAGRKIASFDQVPFSYKKQGKPFFKEYPSFYFNISHSLDYIIAGISDSELGVDIEKERRYKPVLTERFLHQDEYLFLESLPENQSFYFTSIWSLKESYVKYTGEGIANTFRIFSIKVDKNVTDIKIRYNNTPASFKQYHSIPNYLASVCSQKSSFPENLYEIKFQDLLLSGKSKLLD